MSVTFSHAVRPVKPADVLCWDGRPATRLRPVAAGYPPAEGPPQKVPPPGASLGAPPTIPCTSAMPAHKWPAPRKGKPVTVTVVTGPAPGRYPGCSTSLPARVTRWGWIENSRTNPDTAQRLSMTFFAVFRSTFVPRGRCGHLPARGGPRRAALGGPSHRKPRGQRGLCQPGLPRKRTATRSRGSAGTWWPSRPVMSSFATRALATASSVARTTAAKNGFIWAQGMNRSWS